jgi:hypothetical protein
VLKRAIAFEVLCDSLQFGLYIKLKRIPGKLRTFGPVKEEH